MKMPDRRSLRKLTVIGCSLLCLAMMAPLLKAIWPITMDDAYITLRHARNVAEGHGFVYNIGGPRVEGFTNFSLFLFQTAIYALGGNALLATKILGSLAAFGTLAITVLFTRDLLRHSEPGDLRATLSPARWFFAPLILSQSPMLLVGAISGLETTLFAFFLTAASWLVTRLILPREAPAPRLEWIAAGLALGLATWTRPEGLAWLLGLTLCGLAIAQWKRLPRRPLLLAAAIGFAMFAALLAFRLAIYGVPVPNTYFAKVVGDTGGRVASGWGYLRDYFFRFQGALLLAVGAAGLLIAREARPVLLVLLLGAAGHLAVVAWEGGDWMPGLRLIAPIAGVVAVAAGFTVARALAYLPGRARYALSLLAPLALGGLFLLSMRPQMTHTFLEGYTRHFGWEDGHEAMALWARQWSLEREEPLTFVITDIGLLGYHNPSMTIIDMAGLADPEWARVIHKQGLDARYPVEDVVLDMRPEAIVLVSLRREVPGWGLAINWRVDRDFYDSPLFHERYALKGTWTHKDFPNDGYFLHVFLRRDVFDEAPRPEPPQPRATVEY
ncbi:MAG: hypothetical protein RLY93_05910 [Sumerlaeia bacterium]